jgi:phosphoglycerate dehydrogenase-like enzyme
LPQVQEAARNGKRPDASHTRFDLAGRTLGIIGFGAIGQRVAQIAVALGMQVLVYTRTPDPALIQACGASVVTLEHLLTQADFVSMHAAATHDGTPILTAAHLARLKPTTFVINTARGSLIDEQALIAALEAGHLAGAGLDVVTEEPIRADHPLLKLPNVIVTPHALGVTGDARLAIKHGVIHALRLLLKGEPPPFIATPGGSGTR